MKPFQHLQLVDAVCGAKPVLYRIHALQYCITNQWQFYVPSPLISAVLRWPAGISTYLNNCHSLQERLMYSWLYSPSVYVFHLSHSWYGSKIERNVRTYGLLQDVMKCTIPCVGLM